MTGYEDKPIPQLLHLIRAHIGEVAHSSARVLCEFRAYVRGAGLAWRLASPAWQMASIILRPLSVGRGTDSPDAQPSDASGRDAIRCHMVNPHELDTPVEPTRAAYHVR